MSTLEALQERLARGLEAGSRPTERDLTGRIREEGHRLVFLLSGLVRASRLYGLDNDALVAPAAELAEVLGGLVEQLGVVQIALVEDQVYVNDVRLRVRPLEQPVVEQLSAELGRHDVGGVSFHQQLEPAGLKRLARALSSPAEPPQPLAALQARLAELGDLELSGRWHCRVADEDDARGEKGHSELLAQTEQALHDAIGRLDAGWMPSMLRIRRVVIDLVEGLRAHPERAALAPFGGPSRGSDRHLVSVCQLSLMLGRALGLSEAKLSDLGLAALLHDAGYLASRDPVRHGVAGARLLLRQRGWSEAKVHRLLAVAEHTEDSDDPGRRGPRPCLFARILHLAEHYDLLVAPRASSTALSPSRALAQMWSGRGRRYDAALLALFTRELGLHPPGTVLELGDRSWAVVVRAHGDRDGWAHPVVRTVRSAGGVILSDGSERDLRDPRTRSEVRGVIEPALLEPPLAAACTSALAAA